MSDHHHTNAVSQSEMYSDNDEDDDIIDEYNGEMKLNEESEKAALAYLLRYEQMVRQQEAEQMATMAHLRPLFDRLRVIGGDDVGKTGGTTSDSKNVPPLPTLGEDDTMTIGSDPMSYNALRNDGDEREFREEESREKLGHCNLSNLLSFAAMERALDRLENTGLNGGSEEVMSTDKQLVMVLKQLTEDYARAKNDRKLPVKYDWGSRQQQQQRGAEGDADEEDIRKSSLSFPEFLHCYKTVVSGMLVMQMLPSTSQQPSNSDRERPSSQPDVTPKGIQYHRARTRDRVIAMLKTFGPNGTNTKYDVTANQMRKMLTAKDRQLVRVIESHAGEIDEIADRISINQANRKRWIFVGILALVFISWYVAALLLSTRSAPHPTISRSMGRNDDTKRFAMISSRERNELSQLKTAYNDAQSKLALWKTKLSACNQQIEALQTSQRKTNNALQASSKSCATTEAALVNLRQQAQSHEAALRASEASYRKCQSHLKYMEKDLVKLRRAEEANQYQMMILEEEPPSETLSEKEHQMLLRHRRDARKRAMKKSIVAAVAGGVTVIAAPHAWTVLGHVAAATKIVRVSSASYKLFVKIPFLEQFLQGLDSVLKTMKGM